MSQLYKLFSVDDHIIEPADVWSSRVPAKFRDAAPHVDRGRRSGVLGLRGRAQHDDGSQRRRRPAPRAVELEPARFSDMIPGCYDPKARAHDLLSQGVLASVNFPTLPRFGGALFATFKDKELASALRRGVERLHPRRVVPRRAPRACSCRWSSASSGTRRWRPQEIERCVDKGAKALCFVENPVPDSGCPSFHHEGHWDPIWQVGAGRRHPGVHAHRLERVPCPIADPQAVLGLLISLGSVAGDALDGQHAAQPRPPAFPELKLVCSRPASAGSRRCSTAATARSTATTSAPGRHDRRLSRRRSSSGKCGPAWSRSPSGSSCGSHRRRQHPRARPTTRTPTRRIPPHQTAYEEVFDGHPRRRRRQGQPRQRRAAVPWKMADEALLMSPDVSSWRARSTEIPSRR